MAGNFIVLPVDKILREWHPHIRKIVNPKDVFQTIRGLTDFDRELIDRALDREGPQIAADKMIDALKRREQRSGFLSFLASLSVHGYQELADQIIISSGIQNIAAIQAALRDERNRILYPPAPQATVTVAIAPLPNTVQNTVQINNHNFNEQNRHRIQHHQAPNLHQLDIQNTQIGNGGYHQSLQQNNTNMMPQAPDQFQHQNTQEIGQQYAQFGNTGHQLIGPFSNQVQGGTMGPQMALYPAGNQPLQYTGNNLAFCPNPLQQSDVNQPLQPTTRQMQVSEVQREQITNPDTTEQGIFTTTARSNIPDQPLPHDANIDDIPYGKFNKLANALNEPTQPGWKRLAENFKITRGKVKEFNKSDNPAEQLLDYLGEEHKLTVGQLLSHLESLGISNAIGHIHYEASSTGNQDLQTDGTQATVVPNKGDNSMDQSQGSRNQFGGMPSATQANSRDSSIPQTMDNEHSSIISNDDNTQMTNHPDDGSCSTIRSEDDNPNQSQEDGGDNSNNSGPVNINNIPVESESSSVNQTNSVNGALNQNDTVNVVAPVENDTFNNLNREEKITNNSEKTVKVEPHVMRSDSAEVEHTQEVTEAGKGIENGAPPSTGNYVSTDPQDDPQTLVPSPDDGKGIENGALPSTDNFASTDPQGDPQTLVPSPDDPSLKSEPIRLTETRSQDHQDQTGADDMNPGATNIAKDSIISDQRKQSECENDEVDGEYLEEMGSTSERTKMSLTTWEGPTGDSMTDDEVKRSNTDIAGTQSPQSITSLDTNTTSNTGDDGFKAKKKQEFRQDFPTQCTSLGKNADHPSAPSLIKDAVTQMNDSGSTNTSSLNSSLVSSGNTDNSKACKADSTTKKKGDDFTGNEVQERNDFPVQCSSVGGNTDNHDTQAKSENVGEMQAETQNDNDRNTSSENRNTIQTPETDPGNKEYDEGNITQEAEDQPSLSSYRDLQNSIPECPGSREQTHTGGASTLPGVETRHFGSLSLTSSSGSISENISSAASSVSSDETIPKEPHC